MSDMLWIPGRRRAVSAFVYPELAAGFAADANNHLTSTDSAFSTDGADFSFQVWAKTPSNPAVTNYTVFHKSLEYGLISFDAGASGNWLWDVRSLGGNATVQPAVALSGDTWYHIACGCVGTTIWLQVNDGARSTGTLGGAPRTSANQLYVGRQVGGAPWSGAIDEFAYWNRSITEDEVEDFYNGGTGVAYEDLEAGHKTDLVAWFGLNESSGAATWVNAHDPGLDLTGVGTVTSVAGKR